MSGTRPLAALLVLADGTTFEGEVAGAWPAEVAIATGEVVFNTAMTGYQEVVTDPSYAGQIVAFTYPHIGNYGANADDYESARPHCRGIVVRDMAGRPSNWRATESFCDFLGRHSVPAISGIDTRSLTRHIREAGSMPAAFAPLEGPGASDEAAISAAAADEPGTQGRDLVSEVTTPEPYEVGDGPYRVVVFDFGVKSSMLRQLAALATLEVVPASTSAEEVIDRRPDGVFLSNGPGDPAALGYASKAVATLLGEVPVFGICLGHQLLAGAIGGRTYKMPFGHHGGNHPVRRVSTGTVEITSQNHNYAVDQASVARAQVTHVNLNDGVVEGLCLPAERASSVQYHPEAGPGPHDARYLFAHFRALMERDRSSSTGERP